MKQPIRSWAVALVGAAAALALSACVYDPYYPSAGGYSGSVYGYGEGYGYGGSNFSTAWFVGTGDPRWGYDPYCHSYYDYRSRCYYDPYLYGYYPIGYRPPIIVGVPHPYGWSPGHGYCPPPRRVNHVTIVNYRNREAAYRSSNYAWGRHVRQQPPGYGRVQSPHHARNPYSRNTTGANPVMNHGNYNYAKPATGTSPRTGTYYGPKPSQTPYSQGMKPTLRGQSNKLPPAGYNKAGHDFTPRHPNTQLPPQARQIPQPEPRRSFQPANPSGGQQIPHSRGTDSSPRPQESHPSKESKRGIRGLGQE